MRRGFHFLPPFHHKHTLFSLARARLRGKARGARYLEAIMDAKITKKRLGEFLSYEWIKIIAIALAIILFWSLLFSVSGTKLTPDQLFTVFNHLGTKTGEDFNAYTSSLVSDGVFSYEVNEVSVTDLTVEGGKMSGTLLESRLKTGEGDVMYIANTINKDGTRIKLDGEGKPVMTADGKYEMVNSTYLYDFLSGIYYQGVMPIEDVVYNEGTPNEWTAKGILTVVNEYLGRFFDKNGDFFDVTSLDREGAEKEFRNRVDATKDKRFRTAALKDDGVGKEMVRLQRYCEAYNQFQKYLDDGIIQMTESVIDFPQDDGSLRVVKGNFSINLCPDQRMADLQKAVYYYEEVPEDFSGEPPHKADDINLLFFHLEGSKTEFVCERIMFVNYLVEKYAKD